MGRQPGLPPPPIDRGEPAIVRGGWRRLHELGATVVVGTDAGITTGKPHDVLPYAALDLEDIGIGGAQLLTTLTATAANVCGVGDRKGRLAPGYDADILAVGGNPLTDAAAFRDVRGVWRGGRRVGGRSH